MKKSNCQSFIILDSLETEIHLSHLPSRFYNVVGVNDFGDSFVKRFIIN